MNIHEKINYLEFPCWDIPLTQRFFEAVFEWSFTDYGPAYTAASSGPFEVGFYQAGLTSSASEGGALAIFYSNDLEGTEAKVTEAGGIVIKAIFSFPGGRRFHFKEPSGNEFAVWSDQG